MPQMGQPHGSLTARMSYLLQATASTAYKPVRHPTVGETRQATNTTTVTIISTCPTEQAMRTADEPGMASNVANIN